MRPHIQRVLVFTFILFIVNKFILRPWVLENTGNVLLQSVVYSFPNFCEAVMGVIVLTNLAIAARRSISALSSVSNRTLLNTATLIAMIYVLTQEYGLHNLGGNNTFDALDVIASIFGLVFINSIIARTGFENASS